MVQFGWIDLELDQTINGMDSFDESGTGVGYYTRAGIQFEVQPGTMTGFFVRWVDSTIDFGAEIEELELEAVQFGLVVSTSS